MPSESLYLSPSELGPPSLLGAPCGLSTPQGGRGPGWSPGLRVPACGAPVSGDGPSGASALGERLLWVRPGSWISPR